MLQNLEAPWKYIAAALVFPVFFQEELWNFAWGAGDSLTVAVLKRVFLLLPAVSIIFSCWMTVACAVSIIVRSQRREFVSALFLTWWDVGRSLFFYWGGILKLVMLLSGWFYGFARLLIFGLLLIIKDMLLLPMRAFSEVSSSSFRPGVPWPAIMMMVVWTLIEALIFTFVMHPLVVDVLGTFADGEFEGGLWLRSILFVIFTFFVLGSYAVIHTFGQAVQQRKIAAAITYGVIELIVAVVETVLFYREFVDALIPWFAQYAGENFELGLWGTLGTAFAIWFGIRCMTWFLFGASAIPMLLAMIQRTGVDLKENSRSPFNAGQAQGQVMLTYIHAALADFRREMNWVQDKGEAALSAFLLPPSQILAACINFCTLFVSSTHLFSLPFRSYKDILDTRDLIEKTRKSLRKGE
jgi:hypothetical protein